MRRRIFVSLVALAVLVVPVLAGAATITVRSQDVGAADPNLHECFTSTSAPAATCTSGPQLAVTGGTGFGTASANIVSGELKAFASAAATTANEINGVAALGFATMSETYSVSGTGTVTAFLRAVGSWALTELGPPGSAQFQVYADIFDPGLGGPVDLLVNGGTGPFSGSVNQIFSETFSVVDGGTFVIQFDLLAQITGNVAGEIDLSDTGFALVVAGDGVVLIPSDPLFLSSPTFNGDGNGSAVPEPSTLSLLAAGLVGHVVYARRKRRAR